MIRPMSRAFRSLVERQIRKAEARGLLRGLRGEGRPLPDRSGEALVDPALSAGMRIMAEAGVKPREFSLKDELAEARDGAHDRAHRVLAGLLAAEGEHLL